MRNVRALSAKNYVASFAKTSRLMITCPLARDLRVLVRERLQAGESDEKVIKFVVDRYGDFVLLRRL